jgi:hypothetical protein
MSSITPPNPWQNWAENLSSSYATYATPNNLAELQQVVKNAAASGQTVRVSGQRHAQPPLVANGTNANMVLVDLSCYADLGSNGQSRIVLNGNNSVTVNTGVSEDELVGFLLNHQLMLKTVTAGGFFSIGGMTAVDVHGATIDAPIFAETASAYSIMGPDGVVTTIDANTPPEGNWQPLQFARVSLGALGVVTSVTLDTIPRPYANSLVGSVQAQNWANQSQFVAGMGPIAASTTRVETFFNPYACNANPLGWGGLPASFLTCCWNVEAGSPPASSPVNPNTACQNAEQGQYGAPLLGPIKEPLAEQAALTAQASGIGGLTLAAIISDVAISNIQGFVQTADANGSDLWLTEAARTIFMSYFVPLPDLSTAGLSLIWGTMQSVMKKVTGFSSPFHTAFPLEFRIVQSGNSAMAGTYSDTPCAMVNLDLIAVAAVNSAGNGLTYTPELMQFFADVESEWIGLGGWPHNGKIYGFYDPTGAPGNSGPPFNPNMLGYLLKNRASRAQAFKAYQQKRDPKGMFLNSYVNALIG